MPGQSPPHRPQGLTARYRDIAERLAAEIAAGTPAVGEMLPTELALCERFGASRFTVREALRRLSERGLVTRRRGSGTRVVSATPRAGVVQAITTMDEVLQYPPETRLTVETVETLALDAATAALLERPEGELWTRIGGLRRLEGSGLPVAWADLFVRPEYAAVAGLIDTADEPVFRLIARQFGETVEAVDARLSACSIPAALAGPLGVAANGPGLLIVRRYTGAGGRVFEVSASYHPADRFSYAIRFGRSAPPSGAAPAIA